MLAIRCAHLSQTRPGACSLLENAKSWKGCLMCSHLWSVSGKVFVVVVPKNKTQEGTIDGPHTERAPGYQT
jgi:hypothetical protein